MQTKLKPAMTHGIASTLQEIRSRIRSAHIANESDIVKDLRDSCELTPDDRASISIQAANLVKTIRSESSSGILDKFLSEYGLSTDEGVALMCLAEALLRVPDNETIDELISDKIASSNWGSHLGRSTSSLVNASTWALLFTGRVLSSEADRSLFKQLRQLVRRLGEPVVRVAVGQVIKELGQHFVLGQTIEDAIKRAARYESEGYTFSYDMLGEAALSESDARKYHLAYSKSITTLADSCKNREIRDNAGISVKLSALHPRFEYSQIDSVLDELTARCLSLAQLAKSSNMGFNIDAEEADRLDLSLDVIEKVLTDPSLANWEGFGVVVQAYSKRANHVLQWLFELAKSLDRRIMVRLVKGAYWDTEIKHAQVQGLKGYPVFTRKVNTDISYMANARKLLLMRERIYPQFATHNAHSVESILHLAHKEGIDPSKDFEFQRLRGMGGPLYKVVMSNHNIRCRIYAPVGTHQDLLAYLVRRLLENGANSSFVNQITNKGIPPEQVVADPFEISESFGGQLENPLIKLPEKIFGADRTAARGWDLTEPNTVETILEERQKYSNAEWKSNPVVLWDLQGRGTARKIANPANYKDNVGTVEESTPEHIETAIGAAVDSAGEWSNRPAEDRARILENIADSYETNAIELFALLAREAGKCLPDCVAELREAVDFCRYYAIECRRLEGELPGLRPCGVFACISPWNFPLAIFTGQIVAALVSGNTVIAKPAEQTPLIAALSVKLMIEAGVPKGVIQLLPGDGPNVGARLVKDSRLSGVCFTGSTEAARQINLSMAENLAPEAPLIAETGGLNAMFVDSTALPEQAVRDIIISSFQSAGQRCSALRMLYIQEEVKDRTLDLLLGAMDSLKISDPWMFSSDIGPVIDEQARNELLEYCDKAQEDGRLIKQLKLADTHASGNFIPPAVVSVEGIEELEREIFGPVLHVATYRSDRMSEVIEAINAKGYGLTFGLHTRVDRRVKQIMDSVHAGNIYVNRNQIGAVVGSQPFGGEGMSGTGPKAGGPNYLKRFHTGFGKETDIRESLPATDQPKISGKEIEKCLLRLENRQLSDRDRVLEELLSWIEASFSNLLPQVRELIDQSSEFPAEFLELPGPTGESNHLWYVQRGTFVCLGDTGCINPDAAALQAAASVISGNSALIVSPTGGKSGTIQENYPALPVYWLDGLAQTSQLTAVEGLGGVVAFGNLPGLRELRVALALRSGPIVPLIANFRHFDRFFIERTLCVDTTASGGNTKLLEEASD